mmetsp:Transcript_85862/g.174216  ORF Transcript_85862/g.174216 Transcript_85862/m.174216 type:complete len:105 (+) Transcript_85862:1371-1685(+)
MPDNTDTESPATEGSFGVFILMLGLGRSVFTLCKSLLLPMLLWDAVRTNPGRCECIGALGNVFMFPRLLSDGTVINPGLRVCIALLSNASLLARLFCDAILINP